MKFMFFYKVCILNTYIAGIDSRRQIWGTFTNKQNRNKTSKLLCNQTTSQESNHKPV